MPGGERMMIGPIGTFHLRGVFYCEYDAAHQRSGKRIRNQHTPPGTSAFHATSLQSHQNGCRQVLQVIIHRTAEFRHEVVAQASETVVHALCGKPGNHQRHSGKSHSQRVRHIYSERKCRRSIGYSLAIATECRVSSASLYAGSLAWYALAIATECRVSLPDLKRKSPRMIVISCLNRAGDEDLQADEQQENPFFLIHGTA